MARKTFEMVPDITNAEYLEDYKKRHQKDFSIVKPITLQEVTKEFIDKLVEYCNKIKIHPKGSTLILPFGIEVSEELKIYAIERNIEIRSVNKNELIDEYHTGKIFNVVFCIKIEKEGEA